MNDDELFAGVPEDLQVWMSHGDQVSQVSADFQPLAATDTCPIAAVKHRFAADLRPAISPRGHPHAAGPADPGQLPQGDLQVLGHMEDRRLRPRDDR